MEAIVVDGENMPDPKTQRTSRCDVSAGGAPQHTTPYIHTPLPISP